MASFYVLAGHGPGTYAYDDVAISCLVRLLGAFVASPGSSTLPTMPYHIPLNAARPKTKQTAASLSAPTSARG